MAQITRRERIGLIVLLILCVIVIGVLLFRKPRVVRMPPPVEVSDEPALPSDTVAGVEPTDTLKSTPEIKRKKKAKKTPQAPPTPRDYLNEPF